MSRRLFGVLLISLLAFAMASPVMAVEPDEEGEFEVEHEELPSYEELGTGTETADQFRPEPYEQPSVFAGLLYPLLVIATIAVLVIMTLYLMWQPRFSQEREAKKRR